MAAGSARTLGSAALAAVLAGLAAYPELGRPLPAMGFAAVFLFAVVQQDVARARIPNSVTLPALTLALARAALLQGWSGFGWSLLGAGIICAILGIPFALRAIGAGDVKALMVLGALWGPAIALALLWWGTLLAGALAALLLIQRGGWRGLARRSMGWARASLSSLRLGPVAGSPRAWPASGLRFGAVLGLAVPAFRCWGSPW